MFFSEEKNQKTFDHFGFGLPREAQPRCVQAFWFFFCNCPGRRDDKRQAKAAWQKAVLF
jgi:hypothetical protein